MSFLTGHRFFCQGQVAVIGRQCQQAVLISAISVKRVFWAVNSLQARFPAPPEINSDYDQTDLTITGHRAVSLGSCSRTIRQRRLRVELKAAFTVGNNDALVCHRAPVLSQYQQSLFAHRGYCQCNGYYLLQSGIVDHLLPVRLIAFPWPCAPGKVAGIGDSAYCSEDRARHIPHSTTPEK